jgi:hypothetical protein
MRTLRMTISPLLCVAILSAEGCVSLPAPQPVEPAKDLCKAVNIPPPFPKVAKIDIDEQRIRYDDGGLKVLQEYAATREALQAACGK